jgi:very-short-patch-repair endonuclease
MKNKLIPYNPRLKEYARKLRKAGVLSEVILWKEIRRKSLGVEFHRQVPIDNYIVDFYCHELMLVIEVDGSIHELEDVKMNDSVRQKILESFGIMFIRFEDFDVKHNLEFVLRDLRAMVEGLKDIPRST